ncbi:hypothetical protein [Gloeocapsa sp. PCC 73106]|uniref:hypothetical protein n=1 Tax=Gloeocapsa sp. PCC 73106 TaxID=102232 RepID=UPI00031D94B5|nr:hypothetical protein [Gloeocapsa sp. PCC 73106]
MASSNTSQFAPDLELWDSLRQAIAFSSGFKTWLQEKGVEPQFNHDELDDHVLGYLRETLETLAY